MYNNKGLSSIEEAIEDIKHGKMIILCDDEDRESEGDLCMAAEKVTPQAINFMAKNGRGLICLSLTSERVAELKLTPMSPVNTSSFGAAFTISIDAAKGTTTGISAYDRATTILATIDQDTKPEDLVRPGHVFPLKATDGGVLKRVGHTEGSIDLVRLAGLKPAGVICQVMNEDGTMAKGPQLQEFATSHGLKIATIADMISYRLDKEPMVRRVAEERLLTNYGEFELLTYQNDLDDLTHIALIMGKGGDDPMLVRVHTQCLIGDVFQSRGCDCNFKLRLSLERIGEEGRGVLVYLARDRKGINFCNRGRLQNSVKEVGETNKTLELKSDLRDYGLGAQILVDLNVHKIRLLTNNLKKVVSLKGYGLEIVERISLRIT